MVLTEFDNEKVAVINPSDLITKQDGISEIAIACYSKVLFDEIVAGCKCEKIAELSNTNGKKVVYEIEYKNQKIVLFMIGVGAPMAAGDLEDIHQLGVNKFIVFGNCGVLDKKIADCSIIIPTDAIRDEGTSYHYTKESRKIDLNKKYLEDFISLLNKYNFNYTLGTTWTTDAFYRETKKVVEERRNEGAIVVEMEASALQAVADFRNFDFFTFFYAGDNLDSDKWDKRSLDGEVNLSKKSSIAILALEFAYNIISKKI